MTTTKPKISCLAYFLTWSTYAQRLHGDNRGSVDLDHNKPNTPMLKPNAKRVEAEQFRAVQTPFVLSEDMRPIVKKSIEDHAAIRKWLIWALNVRTTHVHLVVDCTGTHTPELALQQFKTWGTRRLIAAGLAKSHTRVWADHGSTRYLNDQLSLQRAIEYVMLEQ
ncbi:MAG: hypothetical protein U0640_09225 [Phycisphaerales bacterium]